jgi:hypothetical protein
MGRRLGQYRARAIIVSMPSSVSIRRSAQRFGAYFKSIEDGHGDAGQSFVALPTGIQQLVREDARRQLEGNAVTGGPVEVKVELLFGCGRR